MHYETEKGIMHLISRKLKNEVSYERKDFHFFKILLSLSFWYFGCIPPQIPFKVLHTGPQANVGLFFVTSILTMPKIPYDP